MMSALLSTNSTTITAGEAVGKPPGIHECSRCRGNKDHAHFAYYAQRVNKNGYLMRSNALCNDCRTETDKERKDTCQSKQRR